DTRRYGVQATLTQLKYLLDGGIRLVQVREKHMPADDYARFMQAILELCRRFDALVLGNTDPETAVALGAHGIHLDSRRLQELDRRPLGAELWVAASCHDRRELDHARQIGADFAVLSPVKATRTHSDARTLGWSRFGALCRHADFPVYALGGMTRDDTCRARHAGGQGVAMISGAWESTGHI
ncbi:MAG: thiamine phosphate synthase, partial [Gammaproteobacteria bacterium]|nr:thiamine phosphate synthase [Gammaproteobacteria bacterium]